MPGFLDFALGGAGGGFFKPSKLFKGKPGSFKTLPTGTPEQQAYQNALLAGLGPAQQSGLEYLQGILSGSPEALAAYQAPYLREFEEQTIPGLAERFSGLGAQKSSAFGQSLSGAAAKLQEDLAAQKATLQGQALGYLNTMSQQAMQPQFQYYYDQGKPSIFSQIAGPIGQAAGAYFGGPMGAQIGGSIGNSIGNYNQGGMGSPFSGPYGGSQYTYAK